MLSTSPLAAWLALVPSIALSSPFLPFLNFTSPSPYIFHSLATLLQTYPQTLFPNGHTIASVIIPRHTLLYHGRHDNDPIPSPEWLALDIEMAYAIMGSMPDSRMLTYRTRRDVKAVYFDGTSASLMGEGTMAQMVLLYNGTENIPKHGGWGPPGHGPPGHGPPGHGPPGHGPPGHDEDHRPGHDEHDQKTDREDNPPRRPPGGWNPLVDEYLRARGLCKWLVSRGLGGAGWGYEGVVRMNAGFEIIWCDFQSTSLKLVSNLNVSAPLLENSGLDNFRGRGVGGVNPQSIMRVNEDEGPHGPGMTNPLEPFRASATWFWFAAAAKRYFGESRIKVNSCGLFSFYEAELPNQSKARIKDDAGRLNLTMDGNWQSPPEAAEREEGLDKLRKRRRQHRLDSVEDIDGSEMVKAVETRLKTALSPNGCSSEVNWHLVSQEIVALYSNELQTLLHYLKADILGSNGDGKSLRAGLESTRALTHWFLLPFLEYPSGQPYDKEDLRSLFSVEGPFSQLTLERCQTQYDIDELDLDDEDSTLYQAIKDTLAGICSTTVEIGLGVEYHWLLNFNAVPSSNIAQQTHAQDKLLSDAQGWKRKLEELMAWLGWVEKWTNGAKSCSPGNIAYVPMWPVSGSERRRRPPPEHYDEERRSLTAPPHIEWGASRFLWDVVCVNASSYPPEKWE